MVELKKKKKKKPRHKYPGEKFHSSLPGNIKTPRGAVFDKSMLILVWVSKCLKPEKLFIILFVSFHISERFFDIIRKRANHTAGFFH